MIVDQPTQYWFIFVFHKSNDEARSARPNLGMMNATTLISGMCGEGERIALLCFKHLFDVIQ